MKSPYDIVLRPVLTEKSYDNVQNKKYTFIVAKDSNKSEIKKAVETIFSVEVVKINTLNRKGKKKRMGRNEGYRPSTKRAIVKLSENSKKIEFFEGMA